MCWHACSAVEITEQYLEQLEAAEPQVRSFITVTAESARASARQLDDRIAREGASGLGPLSGVPFGIKVCIESLCKKSETASPILKLDLQRGCIVGLCTKLGAWQDLQGRCMPCAACTCAAPNAGAGHCASTLTVDQ